MYTKNHHTCNYLYIDDRLNYLRLIEELLVPKHKINATKVQGNYVKLEPQAISRIYKLF